MVKLSKLEQQKLDEMVKEFDWQFYVSYYDGLESLIKNESMAKHHFKNYGFKEGRICCQKQVINLEIYNSVPVIIPVTEIIKDPITESITETIIDPVLKKDIYNISIVMAYYNDRKEQTLRTLDGFETQYSGKYDFEVIIVDDNSNDEHKLEEDIKKYSFPINLIVISAEEKGDRINPCIAYNKGFKEAKGNIIMIQNPECFHVGDLIKYTMDNLTEQDYFSYSCYGVNNRELNNIIFCNQDIPYDDLIKVDSRPLFYIKLWCRETDTCTGNNPNLKNFDIEWYNHPIKHKTGYHYCSAIYKSKLDLIGGFDNGFADGYCFDDDELLLSIKYNLQLNIQIIHPDNGLVIHQFHNKNKSFIIDQAEDTNPIKIKWVKNKFLYEIKMFEIKLKTSIDEDKYKLITNFMLKNRIYNNINNKLNSAYIYDELNKYIESNEKLSIAHFHDILYIPEYLENINDEIDIPKYAFTYWDMSVLSFMHYLTLYTFLKHHPKWTVVLYYPKKRVSYKSWKSNENKEHINAISYINELCNLNIKIVEIDFEKGFLDIPYYLSEVIKSDLFRLKTINIVGGVWFDMDTFWIDSIENKFKINKFSSFKDIDYLNKWYNKTDIVNKNEFTGKHKYKNSYYVFCNNAQNENSLNYPHFCQYILFSNNNSIITKHLIDECLNNLNIDNYESIGTPMFSKLISNFMIHDDTCDWDNFINIDIFAPYKWYQMSDLFEKKNSYINIDKSCCLHWFNGSDISKKFVNSFNHKTVDITNDCNFKNIFNTNLNKYDKTFFKNLNKKISIVMAYYNRKEQLLQTLNSIKKSTYKNIEVIIIDDDSRSEERIDTFIHTINKNINLKIITLTNKNWINPCIAYNIGFKHATGDIIMIQNPEVCHIYDCIKYTLMNLDNNDWLSFNCYGTPNFEYNNEIYNLSDDEIFLKINKSQQRIGGNSVQQDDVGGWLNHYESHFVAYHYLSAIHKQDLFEKMDGGFDEKFKNGAGCDDDHFIKKLIYKGFNFKINEFKLGNPFAIHLYHNKSSSVNMDNYYNNRPIFDEYCKSIGFEPLNNIHIVSNKKQTPLGNRILIN